MNGNGAHFLAIERTKSSSVSNNKNKRLLVVKENRLRGPEKSRASATTNATRDWKYVPKRRENQRDVEPGREIRGGREQHDVSDGGGCEVSNDLQVVKVYVSVLGDERGKKNAMKGLQKLEGYVRGKIGSKISLRLTPEVRFVLDESFERGQKVNSILDVLREERKRIFVVLKRNERRDDGDQKTPSQREETTKTSG